MIPSPTPSLKGLANGGPSPSPRLNPTSRILHHLNTTLPHNVTITPASARSIPSTSASPYLRSSQASPAPYSGQSTPPQTANPTPFELPESMLTREEAQPSPTGKENAASSTKSGNLMRKLSYTTKSAAQSTTRTLRRTTSGIGGQRREQSTGPISRRRSDSKTIAANGGHAPESDKMEFDHRKLNESLHGLGLTDASDTYTDTEPVSPIEKEPQGIAPIVPQALIGGLEMIKIGKSKSRKPVRILIDADGSRISWGKRILPKYIFIDEIREVRFGEQESEYIEELGTSADIGKWCTIIYYPEGIVIKSASSAKHLHLVAQKPEDLRLLIITIEALSKHREGLMTGIMGSQDHESIMRAHWDRELGVVNQGLTVLTGRKEALNLSAMESLCRKLHVHLSKEKIEERFKVADVRRCGELNYEEYKEFLQRLKERSDLLSIYNRIKKADESGISLDRFLSFLENTQKLDLSKTRKRWEDTFTLLVGLSNGMQPAIQNGEAIGYKLMNFKAFSAFMVSDDCNVYPVSYQIPELDRPINEYFISSSHNTYLTGKQVFGESSTEPYITALRHGCRCVEIDCWDGADGQPRVTHGRTKTTSVPFVRVIESIHKYAFDASKYPLILSLEVHCNAEQQLEMVRIMKSVLSSQLLLEPLKKDSTSLPSPQELKGFILVKVKASQHATSGERLVERTSLSRDRNMGSPSLHPSIPQTPVSSEAVSLIATPSRTPPTAPADDARNSIETPIPVSSSSEDSDEARELPNPVALIKKPKPSKITKELADLGVYFQGNTFRGFNTPQAHEYNHIFSLNENTALELCKKPDEKADFEDHNVRYMARVYPKPTRVNSDNFDPNTFWRRGVQMVAMNWQTHDPHMQINEAMFAAGADQTGYVLKPNYLRQDRQLRVNGSYSKRSKLPKFLIKFSVEVVSAQQLPRLPGMKSSTGINPFIEVQMFSAEDKTKGIVKGTGGDASKSSAADGAYGIGSPYSRRTHVIMNNGFNPQFNDRIELSLETKYPELVFVRWIVWHSPTANIPNNNKSCTQLATFTAKLGSLQEGYRRLPMFNANLEEFIFSTLFCKIEKEKPVFTLNASSFQDNSNPGREKRRFY